MAKVMKWSQLTEGWSTMSAAIPLSCRNRVAGADGGTGSGFRFCSYRWSVGAGIQEEATGSAGELTGLGAHLCTVLVPTTLECSRPAPVCIQGPINPLPLLSLPVTKMEDSQSAGLPAGRSPLAIWKVVKMCHCKNWGSPEMCTGMEHGKLTPLNQWEEISERKTPTFWPISFWCKHFSGSQYFYVLTYEMILKIPLQRASCFLNFFRQ